MFYVNNNLNFSNYKFHYKFAYNEFLREKNFPHRYRVNLNFSYPSKSEERATGSKLRNIDIKKNSIQIQILKKENRKITYKKIACLFFFFFELQGMTRERHSMLLAVRVHFKGKREKENFEHALKSRFLGFT